ncbi:MAG: aromatic amino acid lyase [Bacteroidia bacterium]|nr:aromatic amino acid lyase [Bacteroidia bacterium]
MKTGRSQQYKIEKDELLQLQYNLIRSHSCGIGKPLNEVYARSMVLARINNFLQGNSGVNPDVISQLVVFLNSQITPEIYEHGGVGASGDLVQLAHLGLNLIGEGYVYYEGERVKTKEAFEKLNIHPLELTLRDGLAIINGTSCMTGIGAVNLIYAYRLLEWATAASAIINEIVESFDDSFSKILNQVKLHPGQQTVAAKMRKLLSDSSLIRDRKKLFDDAHEFKRSEFKNKIQEYYSIRCVPQILGPVTDTLDYAKQVIENEINSTNDNPVVIPSENNVYHGGNFHGDYISLEMDKLKIAITKVSVLAERQLNFLLNHRLNNKFPSFLSSGKPGLNYGLQGMQFTATSTTAENQSLCNSVYVHSIPNNNDNQDVVSMGTNSAVMAKKVIENSFQVMAIHLIAVCQAIDLLKDSEREKLSSNTKKIHQFIRSKAAFIDDDVSHSEKIREVYLLLKENVFPL